MVLLDELCGFGQLNDDFKLEAETKFKEVESFIMDVA